jgi:hypothetical protein
MEFIGLSVEQVLAILQEWECSYHIFHEYGDYGVELEEVASISYVIGYEWSEYSDGQIEVEFEDGVCVAHYQGEDWD